MIFKNKAFNKFWRFSCSFQLGIPIMMAIAILIAWGTIVESQYNALVANKMIYSSWMMWLVMALLVYNLVVVVIDRWPWKARHYPFILVHAGIVAMILGGYVTNKWGIDGQMVVNIGSKNSMASTESTDLMVYVSFGGDRYSKIYNKEVDFFLSPPTLKKPYVVDAGVDQFEIIEYAPFVVLDQKIKKTVSDTAGASVRFQLMNANVKQVEQITQSKKDILVSYNLGPAKVHLGPTPQQRAAANEVYLNPVSTEYLQYTIYHKSSLKPYKTGKLKIGDKVSTGWVGLELGVLDYLPKAEEVYDIIKKEKPTELTTSAILIKHGDSQRWLALNDVAKLFGNSSAFLLSYQNRRIPLGFDLYLNKFEIQRYQGAMKASSYASQVEIKTDSNNSDGVSATISMNEPMKHNGYTIYQASFQQDPNTGEPQASVFSINQDPGRVTKYFGSLLLSLGIIWLFFQRRNRATAD